MVKERTRWSSGDGKVFHVISRVTIGDHVWIHYILEDKEESKEFSCYEESFLARFTPLPE